MPEVLKRKCTSFFTKEDRETVKDAVAQIHMIMTNASILMRAYYIQNYDETFGDKPLTVLDYKRVLKIDTELLDICCEVVRGKTKLNVRESKNPKKSETDKEKKEETKKVEKKKEKLDTFDKVLLCFQSLNLKTVETTLSLSHILMYSVESLVTGYTTNIWMHYRKYVLRYIRCMVLRALNVEQSTEAISYKVRKLAGHLLEGDALPEGWEIDGIDMQELKEVLVPENRKVGVNLKYDAKSRPWVFLAFMVNINRRLETDFLDISHKYRKLLNPLPMTTSFIPNHIRLDTAGMMQLLMTSDKIEQFVNLYELETGIKLKMKNKANMLCSYKTLSGRSTTLQEDAQFMTELWKFNCNITNNKKNKGVFSKKRHLDELWVFDNSVVTDGYAISFQVTPESEFKKTVRFPTGPREKKIKDSDSEVKEFMDLSDPKFKLWLKKNMFYELSNDPGKNDISAMTNGKKTVRYTSAERDKQNFKKRRQKHSKKKRVSAKVDGTYGEMVNPSVHDYESQYMSLYQRNSCRFLPFKDYVVSWKQMEDVGRRIYRKAYFRQAKVLVYNKNKSSEHRYFNKVKKTFTTPWVRQFADKKFEFYENNQDAIVKKIEVTANRVCSHDEKIVIGWGDWGRNPNLKHSAPTPGIGFRRRAAKHFPLTVTVPERNTSKTCPFCRTKTLEHPTLERVEKEPITRHHLLRCTNVECKSRWWNRNNAGSFNILYRMYETIWPDQHPCQSCGASTLPTQLNLQVEEK